MKQIDVQVLSRENIKPSSPTPDHLRRYPLSFLDQIQPPVFMPLVLFYPKDNDATTTNVELCEKIKKSLSEALTVFYPIAGRIMENSYIDCNDEGVYFVEAKANCQLSDVLESRNPNNNKKFIPLELDDANELPAMVQVTFFECGGLAVFLGMSHKVGDALSYFMLLNSWAAIARGDDVIRPRLDSAAFFPPKDISGFQPRTGIVKDNIVAKIFVFDASTIAALRAKYTDNNSIDARRPTRVEALSAFIWSRFMAATQAKKDDGDKVYTLLHAVNLRTRTEPPLSEHYFGNISRSIITVLTLDEEDDDHRSRSIVNKMRESIKKLNNEYVKQLQESNGHLTFLRDRATKSAKGGVVSLNFTSLCRFPIYEADFGWGKPKWVGSAPLTFKNLVCFFDTKTGGGIEAWINLKEEDMEKLEMDKEFLSYVCQAPNVMVSGTNDTY